MGGGRGEGFWGDDDKRVRWCLARNRIHTQIIMHPLCNRRCEKPPKPFAFHPNPITNASLSSHHVPSPLSFALCSAAGGGKKGKTDDWLQVVVMPHLESCGKSSDHRQRLVCLQMVRTLIVKQREEQLWKKDCGCLLRFFEILVELSEDKLPNVKLNVGRVLGDVEWKAVLKEAGEKGGKGKQRLGEVKDKVKAALKVMMKDEDMDVKYYAKLAKEGGGGRV